MLNKAGWGRKKSWLLFCPLALCVTAQHEYQSPNPFLHFHFSLLLFLRLDWQFLPLGLWRELFCKSNFIHRSTFNPKWPPPHLRCPCLPLFCTLPLPLNYSPTPALGISPHQRLCAPLIRRTAPVATITKESCREPESRPCGNQKAIPSLLNLSAPLTATARGEQWREWETLHRRQKKKKKICKYI